jgi:serine protease inhibitor
MSDLIINNYLQQIETLTEQTLSKLSFEDGIDAAESAIEKIRWHIEETQEKINKRVETLADSFGGPNCTMRDLKGE